MRNAARCSDEAKSAVQIWVLPFQICNVLRSRRSARSQRHAHRIGRADDANGRLRQDLVERRSSPLALIEVVVGDPTHLHVGGDQARAAGQAADQGRGQATAALIAEVPLVDGALQLLDAGGVSLTVLPFGRTALAQAVGAPRRPGLGEEVEVSGKKAKADAPVLLSPWSGLVSMTTPVALSYSTSLPGVTPAKAKSRPLGVPAISPPS